MVELTETKTAPVGSGDIECCCSGRVVPALQFPAVGASHRGVRIAELMAIAGSHDRALEHAEHHRHAAVQAIPADLPRPEGLMVLAGIAARRDR